MGVRDWFKRSEWPAAQIERQASGQSLSVDDWAMLFSYGGHQYGTSGLSMPGSPREEIGNSFEAYCRLIYKRNGVAAACIRARLMLFTEARFQWRARQDHKIFGTEGLSLLEDPWPGGSTGELLARMEQDATLAGNHYNVRVRKNGRTTLKRLRPDWVSIIIGSDEAEEGDNVADAADATIVGYSYQPGGRAKTGKRTIFLPEDVGHYSPEPDPEANFRGMSWLTAALREIETHGQATDHRGKFFEQGAVPSLALTYPEGMSVEDFKESVKMFKEEHAGVANAWKELHIAGGADPKTVGVSLKDIDYKNIQGASETIIASNARVPAVVVGIAEALGGSALNSGNYGQARRQFGEQYAYPSWRMAAHSLANHVEVPAGSELWYDTTDVAYLHEDRKDAAEVTATNATAIVTLVNGGMEPETAIAAVSSGDLTLLKHTGKLSVQLQEPGAQPTDEAKSMTVTQGELRDLIASGWTLPPDVQQQLPLED